MQTFPGTPPTMGTPQPFDSCDVDSTCTWAATGEMDGDANNCSLYYTCVAMWDLVPQQCPPGKLCFDLEAGVCNFCDQATCKEPCPYNVTTDPMTSKEGPTTTERGKASQLELRNLLLLKMLFEYLRICPNVMFISMNYEQLDELPLPKRSLMRAIRAPVTIKLLISLMETLVIVQNITIVAHQDRDWFPKIVHADITKPVGT